MQNRQVINKDADSLKATVYGSDVTQPIDIVNGGVSITGTVLIDSTLSLSINVVESISLSIENNVSISIPDVIDVYTAKPSVDTIYNFFTFPPSDTLTTISSDLIDVSLYDETTIYLFEETTETNSITGELYLTNTENKVDGIRYGNPQVFISKLGVRNTEFILTQPANYLFVVVEGTFTNSATIDIYVVGR